MVRVNGSQLYFLSQGNVGHTGGSRAGKMLVNDQFARDSLSRYTGIELNPSNSNSEGTRRTVRGNGGSSYRGRLKNSIGHVKNLWVVTDFSAIQCVV